MPHEPDWPKLAHNALLRAHEHAQEGRSPMVAQFAGTCVDCNGRFESATKVYYAKGKGALCLPCRELRKARVEAEWKASDVYAKAYPSE